MRKFRNSKNIILEIGYEQESDQNREANMQVNYDLHLTMVDQKVINGLTSTKSSVRCYVCGATPKQFSNIRELVKKRTSTDSLHSINGSDALRCSFIFHIESRFRSGVCSQNIRQKEIHDRFKAELGLKVDEPKQGAANTNDGNTARRAFQAEKTFAVICGLNETLIHRLHMILLARMHTSPGP